MAKIPTDILSIVQKYIRLLDQNGFPIRTAILFGSYAKGTFTEWSDIDLALVSDRFEGARFWDKDKIRRFKSLTDYRISPAPYRPEDFTQDNLFIREILETGVRIK